MKSLPLERNVDFEREIVKRTHFITFSFSTQGNTSYIFMSSRAIAPHKKLYLRNIFGPYCPG